MREGGATMSDPTQATDMADMSASSERMDRGGKVYKTSTLVGSSTASFADAVRNAVARAEKTLRNVEWFVVIEERGRVQGETIEFQVTVEIGFRLEG
jgi:flavin-binding protein dodecin